jgi:hypothetical protein
MIRAVVVLAVFLIGLSFAYAIQILPECKKMLDPIGCTCALQNGGFMEAPARGGGRNWWSKRNRHGAPNEAFVRCNMRERGR